MATSYSSDTARKSTGLDVGVFVLAFTSGVLAYLGLRAWLGQEAQLPVTAALLAIMALYAGAVAKLPLLRVRLDQAGDNSYYLGLLFTLTSMALALYDFRNLPPGSSQGSRQIISNFGIALFTTIAGIFLRVSLHQMRIDPADLEAVTRIELTEAAERLRSKTESVTNELSRFHLEVQQRFNDTVAQLTAHATRSASDIGTQSTQAISQLLEATSAGHRSLLNTVGELTKTQQQLAQEAASAVERLRTIEPPPLTLLRRLEKTAQALEAAATQSQNTSDALRATGESANTTGESLSKLSGLFDRLTAKMREEHVQASERLASTLSDLSIATKSFGDGLQSVKEQLDGLEKRYDQSAQASVRANEAASQVLTRLTGVVRDLAAALRGVGGNSDARP